MKYISLESNFWEKQAHLQSGKVLPRRTARVNYSVVDAQKKERKETGVMLKEQRRQRAHAKAVNNRKRRKQEKEERKKKQEFENICGRTAFLTTGRNIYRGLGKIKDRLQLTEEESRRVRPVLWTSNNVTADPLPRLEWALQLKELSIKCLKHGYDFELTRDPCTYTKFMQRFNNIEELIKQGLK